MLLQLVRRFSTYDNWEFHTYFKASCAAITCLITSKRSQVWTLAIIADHGGISFARVSLQSRNLSLDWNRFICSYQCCGPLWQSSYLLRCVQKPRASYTSQHVCSSAWCKRHSDVHLLYALFSGNPISRGVDFWRSVLSFSQLWSIHVWNGFHQYHGNNCSEPIFSCCKINKVQRSV